MLLKASWLRAQPDVTRETTHAFYRVSKLNMHHTLHPVMLTCTRWMQSLCQHNCRYHKLTLTLLKASWRRAQQLMASRADAIRAVAKALLAAEDEQLSGPELVTLIEVGGHVTL